MVGVSHPDVVVPGGVGVGGVGVGVGDGCAGDAVSVVVHVVGVADGGGDGVALAVPGLGDAVVGAVGIVDGGAGDAVTVVDPVVGLAVGGSDGVALAVPGGGEAVGGCVAGGEGDASDAVTVVEPGVGVAVGGREGVALAGPGSGEAVGGRDGGGTALGRTGLAALGRTGLAAVVGAAEVKVLAIRVGVVAHSPPPSAGARPDGAGLPSRTAKKMPPATTSTATAAAIGAQALLRVDRRSAESLKAARSASRWPRGGSRSGGGVRDVMGTPADRGAPVG